MPEEFVPPVVAVVVVTGEAGPSLEVSLESLASQDYPALDVLVVDASSGDGVTSRVAEVLPSAFVRRRASARGFGEAANDVLSGVDGASFFLFARDGAALAPDALRQLVQEAFRSNASIVGPKLVDWDRPDRLLEVGLAVDRLGAAVPRIEEGELDQAQHDEVREVFAVPSTGMLVRTDLFEALGGYDPELVEAGEDIDLCWRAHLAGARVAVAPQAKVRWGRPSIASRRSTAAVSAQRAGQLRACLKNYGLGRRWWAFLRYLLLVIVDTVAAPITGSRERARTRRAGLAWNLAHRSGLRELRRAAQGDRQMNDRSIVGLMGRRALFRRVSRPTSAHAAGSRWAGAGSGRARPATTVSPASARRSGRQPVHHDSDRITDLIVRIQHGDVAAGQAVAVIVVIFVVFLGVRGLLFGALPVVGQLVPGPTGWHLFGLYFSGLHPVAGGSAGTASPAYGLVGLLSGILGNSYGLAVKVLYLSGLVLGSIGTAHLVREFGGGRSRIVAAIAFLASPLVWNGLARGDLQACVALALVPFVLLRLARATGLRPFAEAGDPSRRWNAGALLGEIAPLGLLLAVALSLAPAFLVDFVVVLAGCVLITLLLGGGGWLAAAVRAVLVAAGGLLVAFGCCLPWSLSWFGTGPRLSLLTGSDPPSGVGPADLLRGFTGPVGHWWGAFGLVVVAFSVLAWARRPALDWAARWLVTALLAVLVAWLGNDGYLGAGFGDVEVLLAPAAVAFAACCGLAVAGFEAEASRHRFGWRQVSAALAVVCFVVGAVPVLAILPDGRAGLPSQGYEEAASELSVSKDHYVTLWLGDPRTIPGATWQITDGLAGSLTTSGVPSFYDLYPALGDGSSISGGSSSTTANTAKVVGRAIAQAESHRTLVLGSLLAPYGIGEIVVPTAEAPVLSGEQDPPHGLLPSGLLAALTAQTDMSQLPEEAGVMVFTNADWTPSGSAVLLRGGGSQSGRLVGIAVGFFVTLLAILEGLFRRRRTSRNRGLAASSGSGGASPTARVGPQPSHDGGGQPGAAHDPPNSQAEDGAGASIPDTEMTYAGARATGPDAEVSYGRSGASEAVDENTPAGLTEVGGHDGVGGARALEPEQEPERGPELEPAPEPEAERANQ